MNHAQTTGVKRLLPESWNRVTERVIACAIEVHSQLGPGLLESLYEQAMVCELTDAGLRVERQRPLRMLYKGRDIGDLRLDIVVESLVIVEVKVVESVLDVHLAQLLSYLRSADLPLGLLLNFAKPRLVDGLSRKINDRCSLLSTLPVSSSLVSPSLSESSATSELRGTP